MPLNEEQVKTIKEQLLTQINSFPENQRENAKTYIESLDADGLEEFLIKNNLLKEGEEPPEDLTQSKCIFCAIVSGQTKSYKIDENEEAIAILEINPISRGHALLIPKKHIKKSEEVPKTIFEFAEKLSSKAKEVLKPKDIMIYNSNVLGHEIINILPIYKDEKPDAERYKAIDNELAKIQKDFLEFLPEKKSEEIKKPEIEIIDASKWPYPLRLP